MSVSKEQWVQIKQSLSYAHGDVHLKCDDYLIYARVEQLKMELVVVVYVDGTFKGINAWRGKESKLAEMGDIARRFYRLRSIGLSAKTAALSRIWGKEACKEKGYLERDYYTAPYFKTTGTFITHIKKHNPSIELLDRDRYEVLRDLQRTQEADHG